ncbi:hypothetical protein J5N97_022452 [Dioscorea zingiberensis]|uniref:Uncharacterized protein n=1 Tax=Dioscorea zingiberensis TaxID=325984 RepID=A0A9D5CB81_9LILI|nr:hypothetical protein J5N97_022452 [Dioscorea zingiberensis]
MAGRYQGGAARSAGLGRCSRQGSAGKGPARAELAQALAGRESRCRDAAAPATRELEEDEDSEISEEPEWESSSGGETDEDDDEDYEERSDSD